MRLTVVPWGALVSFFVFFPLAQCVPENDRCVNATFMQLNIPITGSNSDANFDYANQGVCGARSDRRGVWYSVRGNGNRYTAYICSLQVSFLDYGVFNECNSQDCNGFPDANFSNLVLLCEDDQAKPYSWDTTDGMDYFIHVREEDGSQFNLIVADESMAGNDVCINAEEIIVPSAVTGNTIGATHDFYSPNFCGRQSNQAGVWYEVMGNGDEYTLSVCTLNNVETDFGIFNECGNRNCSGYPESRLARCQDNDALTYTWQTIPNVEYYIHVRGKVESSFAMRIHGESSVENDRCITATAIELNQPTEGYNGGATFDFVDETVCGPRSDFPGVWYVVTGNGYKLTASLCSNNRKKADIGLFNDCDHTQCLGFPSSDEIALCENDETVTYSFDTYIGEQYYIHVRGDDGTAFTLRVVQSAAYRMISNSMTVALLIPSVVGIFLWSF